MLPKLHYFATHWKNGMKVTEGHLNNQQNFFADQLRDRLAIDRTDFNYGLLPATSDQPSLEVTINAEWLEVNQCRAITMGGGRIEIRPGEVPELKMPIQQLLGRQAIPDASTWYIVLGVHPFEQVPMGVVDALETPLHHPYTRPKYTLDIIPVDRIHAAGFGSFHLPVAKIQGGHGGIRIVEGYIPPCTRLDSHPTLLQYYRRFGSLLHQIQNQVFAVTDNLLRQQAEEVPLNPLAQDIKQLMEHITLFVTLTLDHYRLVVGQMPPLYLIELFIRLARTIGSSLRLASDRERFYEYCRTYLALSPTEWALPLLNLQYNHLESKDALDQVQSFLEMLSEQFLTKLSQHRYYTLTPEKPDVYDPVRKVKIRNEANGNETSERTRESKSWFKLK